MPNAGPPIIKYDSVSSAYQELPAVTVNSKKDKDYPKYGSFNSLETPYCQSDSNVAHMQQHSAVINGSFTNPASAIPQTPSYLQKYHDSKTQIQNSSGRTAGNALQTPSSIARPRPRSPARLNELGQIPTTPYTPTNPFTNYTENESTGYNSEAHAYTQSNNRNVTPGQEYASSQPRQSINRHLEFNSPISGRPGS